jgi:hypothetical protein
MRWNDADGVWRVAYSSGGAYRTGVTTAATSGANSNATTFALAVYAMRRRAFTAAWR